jgi:hypothetical protein
MALIEYLKEAVDAVLDEMETEYGGEPLWSTFKDAYKAMTKSIDATILKDLVNAWYKKQAEKGLESTAVKNTVKVLAEALWEALKEIYSIPEARLENVDFEAIDWKPLLERLAGFDKKDTSGMGDAIAEEIGGIAGVTQKDIEETIEQQIEYAEREFEERISDLKNILKTVKEIDAKAYERMLGRLEEILPRIRRRSAEAGARVELGELRAFIATATELLKTVKEAVDEFKKTAEELRKAAAEKPTKPEAAKPIVRPVPVGETAAEQEYLNRLATKWKWGYSPETAEFLAPLTVVWAVATDRLDEYPDLREEAKMWIALNRFVWSSAIGFKRGFLEIEKDDFEWSLRFFDIMKLIENRSPELLEILARFRSRDEVPTGIVYSLAESKLYEFRRTVHGPELGKEVTLRELEEIISRRAAWLEEIEVETGETSPWSAGKTRVGVPRPEHLLTILRGRCPVCGSEKLELSRVYGPYNPPSANCAIATCLNCHTVYRLYGDGRGVIAPPTLDPEKWRQRWENNPAKDSKHPFTEEWIKNVDVFAKAKGFSVEPQF